MITSAGTNGYGKLNPQKSFHFFVVSYGGVRCCFILPDSIAIFQRRRWLADGFCVWFVVDVVIVAIIALSMHLLAVLHCVSSISVFRYVHVRLIYLCAYAPHHIFHVWHQPQWDLCGLCVWNDDGAVDVRTCWYAQRWFDRDIKLSIEVISHTQKRIHSWNLCIY